MVHAGAGQTRYRRRRRAAAGQRGGRPEALRRRLQRRRRERRAVGKDDRAREKIMTNLWSGRFDTAPDAAAFDFGASFRFDRRLFEDDVAGSVAWARALEKAGVLTAEDALKLETALGEILEAARANP